MLRGAKNARFDTKTIRGEDKIRALSQILSATIPENTSRIVAHFRELNRVRVIFRKNFLAKKKIGVLTKNSEKSPKFDKAC